jgi:hypothetical protein
MKCLKHHTKVNDDMKFHYYKKKFKILIIKIIVLCNWRSFATKWMKQHVFNNSLVTSPIVFYN